jgi:hypothetical protein
VTSRASCDRDHVGHTPELVRERTADSPPFFTTIGKLGITYDKCRIYYQDITKLKLIR